MDLNVIKCNVCDELLRSPDLKVINIMCYFKYYKDSKGAWSITCDKDACKNEFHEFLTKQKIQCFHCEKGNINDDSHTIYNFIKEKWARCFMFICTDECFSNKIIQDKKLLRKENKNGMIQCEFCFAKGNNLSKCGNCKIMYYCSKECQKEHWKKVHKYCCKTLAAANQTKKDE